MKSFVLVSDLEGNRLANESLDVFLQLFGPLPFSACFCMMAFTAFTFVVGVGVATTFDDDSTAAGLSLKLKIVISGLSAVL
jgi:hypothetical protein